MHEIKISNKRFILEVTSLSTAVIWRGHLSDLWPHWARYTLVAPGFGNVHTNFTGFSTLFLLSSWKLIQHKWTIGQDLLEQTYNRD